MNSLGLITRSRTTGYYPLSSSLKIDYWWNEYRHVMQEEKTNFLIRATQKGLLEFYFTGIPSTRKDRAGTTIRYSVFGSFKDEKNIQTLQKLAEIFCYYEKISSLGKQLDEIIGWKIETWMEKQVQNNKSLKTPPFMQNFSFDFLDPISSTELPVENYEHFQPTIIGRENEETIGLLRVFIHHLFDQEKGRILFLNLAERSTYKLCTEKVEDERLFLGLVGDNSSKEILQKKKHTEISTNSSDSFHILLSNFATLAPKIDETKQGKLKEKLKKEAKKALEKVKVKAKKEFFKKWKK